MRQGTLVLAMAVEVLQRGQLRTIPVLLADAGPSRQDQVRTSRAITGKSRYHASSSREREMRDTSAAPRCFVEGQAALSGVPS